MFTLQNVIEILFKFPEKERAETRELDKDAIGQRLKDDLLEQAGKLRREVADHYSGHDEAGIKRLRCKEHKSAITCLTVSADGQFLFSASKDCGIMKCKSSSNFREF